MGNAHSFPWTRPMKPSDVNAMFHALDFHGNSYLTLKDLMAASTPGIMMPHSLPALYFFDINKDGMLTEQEFEALVHFCQSEKRKVEASFQHDKTFRNIILKASQAGVKDSSVDGRSSYRRFSSYSNVRSVFSSKSHTPTPSTVPPLYPTRPAALSTSPTQSIGDASNMSASPANSADLQEHASPPRFSCIAMYSSQKEFAQDNDQDASDPDLSDPRNRTALDAAVVERVVHANIHKLADLLHTEGSREEFMAWLWNLVDFNSTGVVTLEELRVLLAALSEDGIYLTELAFYREIGVPLEESIINEFDTTHAGMLSRDEFMVLADLITREYEFWENRHLERIGDYELGRTIGRGSSGVVRLAIHVETRQRYAIKIIKKGKCSDLSRLDREIQSLMTAQHKHIVALEEVLDSETNLFIVMELCGGGSMLDIVRLYLEERMPEETARFFVRQFFEALAFCHAKGICHRDVRLDNLMLDNDGNVKITDFGHSGIYTPGWDYFSTALVGSVYNLSPEQINGQLYSGEKIDVWSAGVAVYCLLVGRPPFFEPEVNPLLESIIACSFETPDFLSPDAKDLIQCMIRASPEERIPIEHILHHPWFYGGPEFGPSMNVVVIPVDIFFTKRPDIAEMIMAITIYQHSLHFHLADTQNPNSCPEDQRGQDWSLKCLCPKNDIKFSVSLFTKKPESPRKKIGKLNSPASYTALSHPALLQSMPGSHLQRRASSGANRPPIEGMRRQHSTGGPLPDLPFLTPPAKMSDDFSKSEIDSTRDSGTPNIHSASRPPRQRANNRVTPLRVAAHIRDIVAVNGSTAIELGDVFDFEPEEGSLSKLPSFRDELLDKDGASESEKRNGRKNGEARPGRHSRSHSLDDPGNLMRINRSATVDAFPYQKVYPQREMPESIRNMTFDRPLSPPPQNHDADSDKQDDSLTNLSSQSTPQGAAVHRSLTYHSGTFAKGEALTPAKSTPGSGNRDHGISQELSRHPSKAISPQSPQVMRISGPSEVGAAPFEEFALTKCSIDADQPQQPTVQPHLALKEAQLCQKEQLSTQFEPYIEVRLKDGESGLFLKICRKLKNICNTKLATAAQRQKRITGGRRSLSALRRTALARVVPENAVADNEIRRAQEIRGRR